MSRFWIAAVVASVLGMGCATTRASFLLRPAQQAEAAGNFSLAAERYSSLLANPATDSETRFRAQVALARLYIERLHRPQEGIALYEQALAERPSHPDAAEVAWRLGKAAFDVGDFAKARLAFLRVVFDLSGSQFDADTRWGLAATYEQLGEVVSAQDAYATFIARYPNDPRRAEAQSRLEALRGGKTFPPLEPTRDSLVATPAPMPQETPVVPVPRNNDEARRLDDAPPRRTIGPPTRPNARAEVESWTASPIFGYNPRDLLLGEGNVFGGEEVEETLRGDGALLDDALLHLGWMFFQMGDYRRAGACLEKVLQLGVEESEAAVDLTVCYLKENALKEARTVFRLAYRLEPKNLARMVEYADSLAESGNRQGAKNALTILMGVDSSRDETIRERLDALDRRQ